jgi:perosamine synthetase
MSHPLVAALEQLYRVRLGRQGPVPLHEPLFEGNEWSYVKECLDTGWVSSVGAFVDRFERELADRANVAFAVATASGTAGLHITLHALGIRPGDLVICPAISFVATANSIAHCQADPLFVDVDADTLGLEPIALECLLTQECELVGGDWRHRPTGRRVAAVMVVHLFGHPARVDSLAGICAHHGLPLIEDAAEALGSWYKGRACGAFGRAGVLSFNGNKIVTTGGGGAILTDDPDLAHRLRHLTTTARVPHTWEYDHDEVGYNYRLPNINAALGCAQLEQLEAFLARKRRFAILAAEALDGAGATFMREPEGATSNYWLNTLLLDRADMRDKVLTEANAHGIGTRPCWRLLPDLPMYCHAPVAGPGVPVARERVGRIINVPSSANLVGK